MTGERHQHQEDRRSRMLRRNYLEDIQKTLLVDALEQKCADKNQDVFETNTVHVV